MTFVLLQHFFGSQNFPRWTTFIFLRRICSIYTICESRTIKVQQTRLLSAEAQPYQADGTGRRNSFAPFRAGPIKSYLERILLHSLLSLFSPKEIAVDSINLNVVRLKDGMTTVTAQLLRAQGICFQHFFHYLAKLMNGQYVP